MESRFSHVQDLEGASEWKHDNGLRALIVERHLAPVAAVMVTYHVGSRNERLGNTGSTHILEHMMFKGSTNFDPEKGNGISTVIEATGALINATTWNDRTNYYNVVQNVHVETALRLEADRMRNLLLRDSDLASEMVVVLNEYERGRNDPHRLLSAELWSTAFKVHPYHFDTIGIKEDITSVTCSELKEFYDQYYHPNNATVTVVGSVETKDTLRLIDEAFGNIAPAALPSFEVPVEPPQRGERRFAYKREGTVNLLSLGFKIPEGRHSDAPQLTVLGSLLTDGKGSLLYRELVDKGVATSTESYVSHFHDPGLLEIAVTLSEHTPHEYAEEVIRNVLGAVSHGINAKDFERARTFAETRLRSQLVSFADVAHTVNEALALGDWTKAFLLPKEVGSATPEAVEMVAKKYLTSDELSVGYLIGV